MATTIDLVVHNAERGTGRVYFQQVPRPDDAWRVETANMGFHLQLIGTYEQIDEQVRAWQALIGKPYRMTIAEGYADGTAS